MHDTPWGVGGTVSDMVMRHCRQCGEVMGERRWRKGKRLCPQCTLPPAMISVALQHFWARLPLETRFKILEPFYVDSEEWRTLFGTEQSRQEE